LFAKVLFTNLASIVDRVVEPCGRRRKPRGL
jgi:hypothetical protein